MASITKYYAIQYYPETSVVNPGTEEIFYKVKSVKESNTAIPDGISLTKMQYKEWIKSLTPFHYINDEKFKFKDAYLDSESKTESDEIQLQSRRESNVIKYWKLYLDYQMVGNEEKTEELKTMFLNAYNQLTIDGKKPVIVEQMMYLKNKIAVLEDLEQDTTELQIKYDDLIDEYNSLLTT